MQCLFGNGGARHSEYKKNNNMYTVSKQIDKNQENKGNISIKGISIIINSRFINTVQGLG